MENQQLCLYNINGNHNAVITVQPHYIQNIPDHELLYIGKGGFGKVYKYHHEIDHQDYAVKKILLTKESAYNALKEIRILSKLNHPNIVRYFNSWLETSDNKITKKNSFYELSSSCEDNEEEEDPVLLLNDKIFYICIKMEYCDSTLTKYLQSDLQRVHKSTIIRNLIEGLHYLHYKQVIHRDLKPDNILISFPSFTIKISDFGLAKIIHDPHSALDHVCNTEFTGTLLYASPEQYKGESYGFETDIYSLGIIWYELEHAFTTECERFVKIQQLRKSGKCSDNLLIEKMINKPKLRPTIFQIYNEILMINNHIVWCRDIVWEIVSRALD